MVLGLVSINSYSIADTYFVGQLGTLPLAAMGFTFPVAFTLMAFGLGVGIGTSSVLSRLLGTGEIDRVQRITTHALILGLFLGLVVTIVGLATIEPVFTALGADELTLPLIREYMEVYYLGGFLVILPMVGNFAMRAAGDARIPALILTIAALINIILDPLLIFGLLGFPRLELQGAALATVISNGLTVVASVAFLRWREHLIRARYLSFEKLLDSWRTVLHVAIPAIASNVLSPITIGVITSFVAVFGPAAVAGFGVASRIESLVMIVIFAVTSSVGPVHGTELRRGPARPRASFRVAVGALLRGVYARRRGDPVARSTALVAIFDSNADVISTATIYLAIVPFSLSGFGVMLTAVAVFNALGKPMPAMTMTFVKLFLIYIPLAWLLARSFGLMGIFAANAAAHLAFGVVGFVLLRRMLATLTAARDEEGEHAEGLTTAG